MLYPYKGQGLLGILISLLCVSSGLFLVESHTLVGIFLLGIGTILFMGIMYLCGGKTNKRVV